MIILEWISSNKKVHLLADIRGTKQKIYRLKNTFIKNKIPIKTPNPIKIL